MKADSDYLQHHLIDWKEDQLVFWKKYKKRDKGIKRLKIDFSAPADTRLFYLLIDIWAYSREFNLRQSILALANNDVYGCDRTTISHGMWN